MVLMLDFVKCINNIKQILKKMEETNEFVCACGRRFKSENSLKSHARFCDKYIHKNNKYVYVDGVRTYVGDSIYKINENCYRCECGREFDNFQSLNAHFSHCNYHHEVCGTKKKLRPHIIKREMAGWGNKSKNELKEIHDKATKTYKNKLNNGEITPSFKNRKHLDETKEKIRQSTIKNLELLIPGFRARYNKDACKYIDLLNIKNNWNLIHAENGGEKFICGYFVDGYDEEKNIVFEYDESRHYIDPYNNILKQKDIDRQNYIISNTGCEFYRYNEKIDLLYKIENIKKHS